MIEIPFDIIELIISIVADGDREVLKGCTMACKTFLHLARRYLYSTIDFIDAHEDSEIRFNLTKRFNQLLDQTPEIALLVRSLSFKVQDSDFFDIEINLLLKRLLNLKKLFIYPRSLELAWSTIPLSFRSTLVDLLHLPTLTHVTMMYFTEVPLSTLATAIQIENLTLTDVELQTSELDASFSSPVRDSPHLKYLKLGYRNIASMSLLIQPFHPSTRLPFDMKTMELFEARSESLRDMEIIKAILALSGPALKSLHVNVKQNDIYALELSNTPYLQSLKIYLNPLQPEEDELQLTPTTAQERSRNTFDLTCVPDLRSLSIRFSFSDREEPSLYGIISPLSKAIRSPFLHMTSILVQNTFDAERSFQLCWNSDSWRTFDTALASSGFPLLRKVTIESRTAFDTIIKQLCNHGEMVQLKKRCFPLLSARRDVDFDFNSMVWNTDKGQYMKIAQ